MQAVEGTSARILVQKGDWLKLIDHGNLEHGALNRRLDARGAPNADRSYRRIVKKAPFACLLARIGEKGKPFAPPMAEEFYVRETGVLYFLVNDKSRVGNAAGWTIVVHRVER